MTKDAKKPRRRRVRPKAGGKEIKSQTKPVEAESEKKPKIDPSLHAKISSQALGITTMDTIDRINSIPDLSKKLNKDWLENTLINVVAMEISEIQLRLKVQKMSAIEQSIYIMVASMLKEGKSQKQIILDVWARVSGAPRTRAEITGAHGGAIEVKTQEDRNKEIREMLLKMSPEDREEYIAQLEKAEALKSKYEG